MILTEVWTWSTNINFWPTFKHHRIMHALYTYLKVFWLIRWLGFNIMIILNCMRIICRCFWVTIFNLDLKSGSTKVPRFYQSSNYSTCSFWSQLECMIHIPWATLWKSSIMPLNLPVFHASNYTMPNRTAIFKILWYFNQSSELVA